MKNKINQLKSEADEMGVTPELLALCYIHEALTTLQELMDRGYQAAKHIEASIAHSPKMDYQIILPCRDCKNAEDDGNVEPCFSCQRSKGEYYPNYSPKYVHGNEASK